MNNNLRNILKLLNIAVISGILFGLFFAAIHILRNRYIDYEVYNIALLDLRAALNEYLLVFILIALGLFIIDRVVSRLFFKGFLRNFQEKNSDKNIPTALSYSLALIFILAVISFSIYPDIISFLKSTSLAQQFHKITTSRSETYQIFIAVFAVLGLIFIALSTYVLSKYKLVSKTQELFSKIANSRPLQVLGASTLGLVILFNLFMLGYSHASSPEGPNIIVISIDTLRADHLGSYGYERDTSPNIDKLAEKGILFENAYAQGSWTYPSMASMHTSLYPTQIGVQNLDTKIHDSFMTLAEYMKNNFYDTHAVISNIVVSKPLGFSQGFDTFNEDSIQEYDKTTSHLVTDQAIEYVNEMKGEKFFLWLHYMDPHFRYVHYPKYNYSKDYNGSLNQKMSNKYLNIVKNSLDDSDIQYIKDLYDEEISYTDSSIGQLLDAVDKLGLMDNTVIILTADHGEEFMERARFGHGRTLYQELIHIPLIIYVPGNKDIGGKRVRSSVELKSIGRTVLDLSGIVNTQFRGQNLLIAAEDENNGSYAYSQRPGGEGEDPLSEAIISDNWKLINNLRDGEYELYDLENDPNEKKDLFKEEQNGVSNIRKELLTKLSEVNKERMGEPDTVKFNEEDINRLKALGYIQ
jgi:arylsulfatase A-like enzyme